MNQITIAGHLGADPEVRFTSGGQKVTTLRVAAKSRRGKDRDETIWYRVTIWGEQFDGMIKFLKKGSPVIVLGELSKPEIFTDREGNPQISMNVTANQLLFSPFGRADGASGGSESSYAQPQTESYATAGAAKQPQLGQGPSTSSVSSFNEDEIPF